MKETEREKMENSLESLYKALPNNIRGFLSDDALSPSTGFLRRRKLDEERIVEISDILSECSGDIDPKDKNSIELLKKALMLYLIELNSYIDNG